MKKEALQLLYKEMQNDTHKAFQKTEDDMVFGQGNHEALVMLVGEAPGAEETKQKKPFVGKAGENLNEFLQILDMKREDIFITNVVKFRPYIENSRGGRRNRPPSRSEQEHQVQYLLREIALIKPKVVVTLGNVALRGVARQQKVTIGEVHGKATPLQMDEYGFLLFPLYHPASIIYNRSLKTVYESDLVALKDCFYALL